MAEDLAKYSCDNCRARKITCSRDSTGCTRCNKEAVPCVYSRSGIIRRNRKRKRAGPVHASPATATSLDGQGAADANTLQSSLAPDIETAQRHLQRLGTSSQGSLKALSSLADACAAVWHDDLTLLHTGQKFYLFESQTMSWVTAFVIELKNGRPNFSSPPPDVLDHLRSCRPDLVQERAWLVMYYSIVLGIVSSTDPADETTMAKLRCNLWLALNDARLLLEASEANIQALIVLAIDVEEFTKPSLCWMLVTNACRMLQALGINHRRLSPETRQRRTVMFWHLNLVDIGLALIFGRPPTFQRAMTRQVPLPTLDQLLPFQPHISPTGAPALFGVHYIHQMFLLSRVMSDIWHCLHEESPSNEQRIGLTCADLDAWYSQAQQLLQAAALAEKPFLDSNGIASIDHGLNSVSFQYEYLLGLLARSSPQMSVRCIASSRRMLHLLDQMVTDNKESYNGMVWHLLCGPFTPFLGLFGEILTHGANDLEGSIESLAAMKKLPIMLQKLGPTNSLAAKLERVAVVLVQHAQSVVFPDVLPTNTNSLDMNPEDALPLKDALPDQWPLNTNNLDWDSFFSHTDPSPSSGQPQVDNYSTDSNDLSIWTNDFFDHAFGDWIGWDGQA